MEKGVLLSRGDIGLHDLDVKERAAILTDTRDEFISHTQKVQPTFGILLHGSSVYGFNPDAPFKAASHSDLDAFLVVQSRTDKIGEAVTYPTFVDQLHELVNVTKNSIPDEEEFQRFTEGDFRLRIEGHYQGIPIGFHAITLDGLREGASVRGVDKPFPVRLPNNDKYKNETRATTLGDVETVIFEPVNTILDENWIMVPEFFSRTAISESETLLPTRDHLADKFLNSRVVFDPGFGLDRLHTNTWSTFIRSSIHFNPAISDSDILGTLHSPERYSPEYTDELLRRIGRERQRLGQFI